MPNRTEKIHIPHLGESWKIIIMILAGWSCYSLADVAVKILASDYIIWQIMITGSGSCTLFSGLWILFRHGLKGFIPKKIVWTALRCVVVVGTALSVVNSIALIPLADFYGITFAAPFLTLILVHFFLDEHVGWHRWLAVAIGFTGVIILAGPQFAQINMGYLLAFIGMICISLGSITLRKVGKDDPPALYAFWPFACVFCVVLPLGFSDLRMPETKDFLFFGLQVTALISAQILVSFATASAKETAAIAPFVYIQIIWGVLFGYLIFNDPLSRASLIGLPLIISAGLYMIYRERKLKNPV